MGQLTCHHPRERQAGGPHDFSMEGAYACVWEKLLPGSGPAPNKSTSSMPEGCAELSVELDALRCLCRISRATKHQHDFHPRLPQQGPALLRARPVFPKHVSGSAVHESRPPIPPSMSGRSVSVSAVGENAGNVHLPSTSSSVPPFSTNPIDLNPLSATLFLLKVLYVMRHQAK